ncbi:MAG TPA: hypothetical protein VFA89_08955 [Terriglobales bacterium]|nr:hypothetical protein [Terriglobales bacterium]
MSCAAEIVRPMDEPPKLLRALVPQLLRPETTDAAWDPQRFATEQIRGLVRQVFFPGWPRPARQVVISGIHDAGRVAEVCARVAIELAAQVRSRVCAVETEMIRPALLDCLMAQFGANSSSNHATSTPEHRQFGDNLFFVSGEALWASKSGCYSAEGIGCALSELRRRFEYTVLHAPPAGIYNQTALMARASDGIILVLEAGRTRRLAARQAAQLLRRANARLIGTVLNHRMFPVPEAIYRRL